MEITSKNFKENLPLIKSVIEKADFIAIDGEFTGLYHPDGKRMIDLDTTDERYQKAKFNISKFGLIQYGLTTFRLIPEEKKYKTATFCFYLLGKSGSHLSYDPSSMNFLADHKFDFNKLFKDGLPYISMAEEEVLIQENKKVVETESLVLSPLKVRDETSKKFLKEAKSKVYKFIEETEEKSLIFPGNKLSGFHRKLLYNNVGCLYPNILIHTLSGNNRDVEVLKFTSQKDREEFLNSKREEKLQDKVGFTEVMRHIFQENKPIVGHNVILDLLHSFHKFVQPLPESLDEFKTIFKTIFPPIYDTKLLAKDPPFCVDILNSALGNLYDGLVDKYKPPNFEIEDGCQSYVIKSSTNEHDAGYDAFITGVSFVTMIKSLDGVHWTKHPVTKSTHLPQYLNKINMMNSYDLPSINLAGPDVKTDRSHIFEVRCPSDWTQMNVRSLFPMLKSLKTTWLNSEIVYVIPQETDDVEKAQTYLAEVQASTPPNVHVKMFSNEPLVVHPPSKPGVTTRRNSSKRKSANNGVEDQDTSTTSPRDLKRLKSVGSDQLSQLTLESPTEEKAQKSFTKEQKKVSAKESSNDFHVPDEW